jgi:hypothetical protein
MHHYISASPAVCAVVSIGIANVERKVLVRVGIHLPRPHGVEPLGRLSVAFPGLRAKLTRPAADWISLKQSEVAFGNLFPDLDLRFFLEQAD